MRNALVATLLFLLTLLVPSTLAADAPSTSVSVNYRLPTDGPLPQTYLVTLAVVDAKNPDWIISQFAAGVERTVTAENQGKFTETWDGLDDNFMPVPPGEYALRGICSPAEKWAVDGAYHAVTPRFHSGSSSWLPTPEQADKEREPFGGDPTNAPMGDIAVGPNGHAVFYYSYLENGRNNPVMDLNQAPGFSQVLRSYNSGGAGGGNCTATDGQTIWSFCNEGGRKYVYRADEKPFGTGGSAEGSHRKGVYLPDGWVTGMTCRPADRKTGAIVYIAQRGKIVSEKRRIHTVYLESETDAVDKLTVHAGDGGKILAEVKLRRPGALTFRNETLYALSENAEGGSVVLALKLEAGLPGGEWKQVFAVPRNIKPFDVEVDSAGRIYLSDANSNHVYQFDAGGKHTLTYGRLDVQKSGSYDPHTLMMPGKMAVWTDAQGVDRLLVIERAGPNRVSEWSTDGKLIREFMSLQTRVNDGYAIDREKPEHVYVPGHEGWLTRFFVDYDKGTWTVDAVYPDVGNSEDMPGLGKSVLVRANGRTYLCGSRGGKTNCFPVYRLDGDRWVLSAALSRVPGEKGRAASYFTWHDANNDGKVDDAERAPIDAPAGTFNYHGQNWTSDFALVAMNQNGRDVWRLAPDSFDAHGNPVFKQFQKLFTDPIFEARAAGKADAIHGGNELDDKYSSDWMQADGSREDGYYVQARGGKSFSANEASQFKVSRYVPDGKGGFALKWRTGRAAIQGNAKPGELYGGMRIRTPINGLVPVIDQSRCGVLLYTEDGLYVDTIFPDGRRFKYGTIGMYTAPGEFFCGSLFSHPTSGKIYIAMGKYTALFYEAQGWSAKENPVRPLTELQKTVTITAAQTATPPEIALSVRGGAGTAKLARFGTATGGVSLDGSMAGWESAEAVTFSSSKEQTVEVRCLYDPQHIYLRWHARLGATFEPKPLAPAERVFAHDRAADTLSFYVQGDPLAKPNGPPEGRAGDARFVFGLFKDGDRVRPAVVGMYPKWAGPGKASPQTYATPVGRAVFEHVGELPGVQLGAKIDEDGNGFVIAAALPRSLVAPELSSFAGGFRTLANFSATFGGHNCFWWANTDGSASRETYDEPTEARLYPGSWAPVVFQGLGDGVVARNWLICGPFGGPGWEKFKDNPNGQMPGTTRDYKAVIQEACEAAAYPPDSAPIDPAAVYTGEMIRGYWPDPRRVSWRPAEVADLDTRVLMGPSGQTWYAATWVYAPRAVDVEFRFQGHMQTYYRWTLNGEAVLTGQVRNPKGVENRKPVAAKTLSLREGWNEVRVRGYVLGYPPYRVGLVLSAAEDVLWGLKMTGTPPALAK